MQWVTQLDPDILQQNTFRPSQKCEDRTVDEVLKLSDISDLSPEPLYEVLKIVQECGDLALGG